MNKRRALFTAVVAALALAITACGDKEETTVTETTPAETTTAAPATSSTTTPTSTSSSSTTSSSTTATTTTGSTTSPAADCDFDKGEIYSEGTGGCVQQRSGNNPCPPGEVPMADQAVCTKE